MRAGLLHKGRGANDNPDEVIETVNGEVKTYTVFGNPEPVLDSVDLVLEQLLPALARAKREGTFGPGAGAMKQQQQMVDPSALMAMGQMAGLAQNPMMMMQVMQIAQAGMLTPEAQMMLAQGLQAQAQPQVDPQQAALQAAMLQMQQAQAIPGMAGMPGAGSVPSMGVPSPAAYGALTGQAPAITAGVPGQPNFSAPMPDQRTLMQQSMAAANPLAPTQTF